VGDTLFIAMAGSHQLWRFDPITGRVGPFAGSGAEGMDDGLLGQASFAQSSGLAHHASTLYVADPEASAVRAVDLVHGTVNTLIGHGLFTFGLRDGAANQALLQHDQGLAWLAGHIYIADTFNNAIRVLDLEKASVRTLARGLSQPGGLAVLNEKTLLVADTNANRIVTLDIASGRVQRWETHGI